MKKASQKGWVFEVNRGVEAQMLTMWAVTKSWGGKGGVREEKETQG